MWLEQGLLMYFALKLGMPWYVCMIAAIVIAALVGGISGALGSLLQCKRSYFLYHAELDFLYVVNMILDPGEIRVYSIHRRSFQRQ